MPRTPEQYEQIREERRKAIMSSALDLFANQGYTVTTISQIAEKAGISKGLLYNYFTSKEDLLKAIMTGLTEQFVDMFDPNHDDVISDEEALDFFDLYFDMLRNRIEEFKLYYQLSMQPKVIEYLKTKYGNSQVISHQKKLLFDFFSRKPGCDPMLNVVYISSVLKGFTMQYVFSPEFFTDDIIENFKEHLKNTFIRK
jgi:AcrR family transcriptional regulator